MYSEIYVKSNVKDQFDSKYLDKLGLTKESFDGQKYEYPGEATEFLYMDELRRTFKSWLFCEFGEDFYIMDSNDGSFVFECSEMDWSGEDIKANGDLILMKNAYKRCIEYCQELSPRVLNPRTFHLIIFNIYIFNSTFICSCRNSNRWFFFHFY